MPSLRRSRILVATLGAALVASTPVALSGSADAAVSKVPAAYFGMHDASVTSTNWSTRAVGSLRMWDNGVTWKDLKPTRAGAYNWSALDTLVGQSVRQGSDPVIVLGGTPSWAADAGKVKQAKAVRKSLKLGSSAAYLGGHAADPPRTADWNAYVKAVVSRYKAKGVHAYQIWNEPNVSGFWNGSPQQMKALSDAAVKMIRKVDRSATIVSPSFVLRLPDAQRFFVAYAATGAFKKVDVVSLHLYPLANQTPEQGLRLYTGPASAATFKFPGAKYYLKKYKVSKPVWDGEVNYGLASSAAKHVTYSSALGAAYVARTYLLSRPSGVSRVYWYNWARNTSLFGIQMTTASGAKTPAAVAYETVRRWLVGQQLVGCKVLSHGTYRCEVRTATTVGWIYWNPGSYRPKIKTPAHTYQLEYQGGSAVKAKAGVTVRMGKAPIMIRVKR